MKTIVAGKEVSVEVIGGFKIDELDKEYALCTYDDDKTSDRVLMIIMEVNIDEYGVISLASIPDEEKELVLEFYNAIKNDILEGDE